mmetsp:Transcript_17125/g.65349  ORF Transcript_17125/g.65349 Transcript_17125/m.65349 type:complete len:342 (+) Transcript_17125:4498-5523(+)
MHQLKEVLPVGDELETKAPAGVGGLHHLGDPRGDLALHSPHRERVCVEMLLREAGEIRRVVHHKASVLHVLHKGLRGAARGRRAHVPLDALVVVHLLRRPAARYPGQVHVEGPSQSQHPEGLLQSDQAISVAESVGVLAQHDVEALILEGQVEHGPLHEGEVPFALHARHGRRDGLLDDVQPHEAALREPLRQRADGVALAAAHVQHADALLQPLLMLSHELLGGGLSSGAQLAPRLWVASRKDVVVVVAVQDEALVARRLVGLRLLAHATEHIPLALFSRHVSLVPMKKNRGAAGGEQLKPPLDSPLSLASASLHDGTRPSWTPSQEDRGVKQRSFSKPR